MMACLSWSGASLAEEHDSSKVESQGVIKIPEEFPKMISDVEFYEDIKSFKVRPEFVEFRPNYPLWTDGALKTRWAYFPPGTQIDNSDPNQWIFPIGTIFVKEFRKTMPKDYYSTRELKVETRFLAKFKEGPGEDAWHKIAYSWNREQTDAELSEGYENVIGTNHDIPTKKQCIQCHQGNVDFVLGFDAIQLSAHRSQFNINAIPARYHVWNLKTLDKANMLTHPFKEQPQIPGTTVARRALGYLHGNCGHCHTPRGEAFKEDVKHLILRNNILVTSLKETDVYKTAVNQPTRNFTRIPYIIKGAQDDEMAIYQSAIYVRMNSLLPKNRMPQIGRKTVDYHGVERLYAWLQTLTTPDDLDLVTSNSTPTETKAVDNTGSLEVSVPSGLAAQISFTHANAVPKVLILYLPEDESLTSQPILDHDDGDFTKRLIVGAPGEQIVLRNSDEIGHTIYAELNPPEHVWDVDFMPANSSTSRPLSTNVDEFYTLKCKLHDYMLSWAGAIKTKYYKIIDLEEGQQDLRFQFGEIPPEFSQIKLWMPEYEPIALSIKQGEEVSIDLIRKGTARGKLILKRN